MRTFAGRGPRLAAVVTLAVFGAAGLNARVVRDHRSPSVSGGAFTLTATPVFEMTLTFTAGQTRTCETRNLTPNADPVLDLMPLGSSVSSAQKVTVDDIGTDLNARLTFRSPAAGRFRLILRAAHNGGGGKADLFCDGKPVAFQLPVGGVSKRLESLRTGERLTTVALPGGPRSQVVYVIDDQGRLLERHPSGANESAVLALGVRPMQVVIVAAIHPDPAGPVRLVRNDAGLSGHDPDKDGLGSELEKSIGTCSNRTEVLGNWECSRSTDPRDTDGDGIPDGVELLGSVASAPFQFLPRWGADPLHKDLFVEVDYMARTKNDPPRTMSRENALALASIYADSETNPLLRLAHAQSLLNPDLKPGISVHLDTGLNPPAGAGPMELATYGDWGGHNVAPPICKDDDCHGADAKDEDLVRRMMDKKRFGLFHYALGYSGSGGQAPFHTFAFNIPLDSPAVAAHEMGHTLGLDHSGPQHEGVDANCKPNYPSIMSYAYLGMPAFVPTFSDGFGRPVLNNISLLEKGAVNPVSVPGKLYLSQLSSIFGYTVDAAAGNVDWNRDGAFSAEPVTAYANDNRSGCEFTRVNAMILEGLTDGAIALTRLGKHTMVIYGDERNRKLSLEFTDDDLSCPGISEGKCGPPFTRKSVDESWNKDVLSVDAHGITVGGAPRTLVVFRTSTGLFETLLSPDFKWTAPVPVPVSAPAVDEFSLAGVGAHAVLAFKNPQGNVVTKQRENDTGAWGRDEPALDPAGAPIGPLAFLGAPGLLAATSRDGTPTLFLAAPVTDKGFLRLFVQNAATGRWIQSPLEKAEEPTFGRPAMAFVPVRPDSVLPGKLHLISTLLTEGTSHVVRLRTLQAKGTGPGATMQLVGSDHDNTSFFGNGVDLLFEEGIDSNLRSVIATAIVEKGVSKPHMIQFRPKADGIVSFVQRNGNDWEALGIDLCRTLHLAGADVACREFSF